MVGVTDFRTRGLCRVKRIERRRGLGAQLRDVVDLLG
jgi:hypothetical protein